MEDHMLVKLKYLFVTKYLRKIIYSFNNIIKKKIPLQYLLSINSPIKKEIRTSKDYMFHKIFMK